MARTKKEQKYLLFVLLSSEIDLVNSIVKELLTGLKASAGDLRVE